MFETKLIKPFLSETKLEDAAKLPWWPWQNEADQESVRFFLIKRIDKEKELQIISDTKTGDLSYRVCDVDTNREYGTKNTIRVKVKGGKWGQTFYELDSIGDALVMRFYGFNITWKKMEKYKYNVEFLPVDEFARICIKGKECWRETKEEISPYPLGAIFRSSLSRALPCTGFAHEDLSTIDSWLKKASLPKCIFFMQSSVKELAYNILKANQDCKFHKDTPQYVIDMLSQFSGDDGVNALISNKAKGIVYIDERENLSAIISDEKKTYFFRHNDILDKWYEINKYQYSKRMPFNSRVPGDNFFDGTALEDSFRSCIFSGYVKWFDVLYYRDYLAIEQAYKLGLPGVTKFISHTARQGLIGKKDSLKDIFNMSGRQLRRADRIIERIIYPYEDVITAFKDPVLQKTYPAEQRALAIWVMTTRSNSLSIKTLVELKPTVMAIYKRILKAETENNVVWENAPFGLDNDPVGARIAIYTVSQMVHHFADYVVMTKRLKKSKVVPDELKDWPINVKPSRIKLAHDRVSEILTQFENEAKAAPYQASIRKQKEEGKKYEYSNDKYSIVMPNDAYDIVREGALQHHCVGHGGYIEKMAEKKTRILFLRKTSEPETPFLTIEERDGKIAQCYGKHDTVNTDKGAKSFIENYAVMRNLSIDCMIYKEPIKAA